MHSDRQELLERPEPARRVRVSSEPSRLTRLGLVYAHPIRLKIVTELYMREMSPTQFFEEFAGISTRNGVHWHFRQLAAQGWLQKVRTEKRHGGRGRPQDVYRATELAVLDPDAWRELPLSIRSAFSQRTLEQMREQVDAAFAAETFDSRADRHLSWTPVVLDPARLEEQFKAMTACFDAVLEEQEKAKVRLASSEEEPTLMTVALAGFESPLPRTQDRKADWPAQSNMESHGVCVSVAPSLMRLAKVFVDPVNLKIVTALNFETLSPSQLAVKFESPSVFSIDRRCKLLTELGWIIKVGEKTGGERRGATENFYRATRPAVFDDEHWSGLSSKAKKSASAITVRQFWERIAEALRAGTFDARVDRHLTWCPLLVDQDGWSQVIELLEDYFEALITTSQEGDAPRVGEGMVMGTFFLAGFESPQAPSLEQLAVF
jgi:hypothetical protein